MTLQDAIIPAIKIDNARSLARIIMALNLARVDPAAIGMDDAAVANWSASIYAAIEAYLRGMDAQINDLHQRLSDVCAMSIAPLFIPLEGAKEDPK